MTGTRNPSRKYFRRNQPYFYKSADNWEEWDTDESYDRTFFIGVDDSNPEDIDVALYMIWGGRPVAVVGSRVLTTISNVVDTAVLLEAEIQSILEEVQELATAVAQAQIDLEEALAEMNALVDRCEGILEGAEAARDLAKDWAVKMDGMVVEDDAQVDYSAKYYANEAGNSATSAAGSASSASDDADLAEAWANKTDGTVGDTNEYSAKHYANATGDIYTALVSNTDVATVSANITNVNAVAGISSAVSTVANKITEVDTVAWISNDVTTVAGVATAVSTVAANDANVTTVATNISNVNTAAANMTAIQNATTAASNAANSATAAANSASASANSAELSRQYANDKINQTHITNCITEIPQDIKLELNNGTLTLKAGSKVYVPNGFEEDGTTPKFDVVTIDSDINGGQAGTNSGVFYLVDPGSGHVSSVLSSGIYSGSTAPTGTTYAVWYDTVNNRIGKRSTGSSTFTFGFSFPVCVGTIASNLVTSIDQVFNGFGYIGGVVWVTKGVKGLACAGRNPDGTLANREVVFDSISISSNIVVGANTTPYYVYMHTNNIVRFAGKQAHFEQNEKPVISSTYASWYSPAENLLRFTNNRGVTWEVADGYIPVADIVAVNSTITSFTPKLPFQAVDRNDSSWFRARFDENLKAGMLSPFAGSTAPDGWLMCDGSAISRTTYADLFAVIGTTYGSGDGSTTFNIPNYTGARLLKGTTVPVKGNGKTLGLWNGTNAMGLVGSDTYRGSIKSTELNPYSPAYNKAVNNTGQKPDNTYTNKGYYGITTDAAKSGVVVDLSTSASVYYIIKY